MVSDLDEDRGEPVVHDEEGWLARYKRLVGKRALLIAIILMVVLIIGDAIFFWWMSTVSEPGELEDLVNAVFYLLIIGDAVIVAVVVFVYYTVKMRGPTPGIYEKGVQLPGGRFIPFDTIQVIGYFKQTGLITRGTITITCPTEEGADKPFVNWTIPYGLFGQEGYEAIRERTG
jgi:hypothetical protein